MKFHVFGILVFVPVTLFFLPAVQAQSAFPITDCLGAQVLCSDSAVVFVPQGYGINDFADSRNDEGCLTNFEVQSAWYYFEFQRGMPRNSRLQFAIIPLTETNAGGNRDFDFALYGPNVQCDSLGSPARCSETYGPGRATGLDSLATGTSERGNFPIEDGFVSDIVVQPGEGYYLLLNNWDMTASEFRISWGGSAAPWLNCRATPGCDPITVSAGRDTALCHQMMAQEYQLAGDTSGVEGGESLYWTGIDVPASWLSDSLVLSPVLSIPAGFSGRMTYVLHAGYEDCITRDTVQITVFPAPELPLPRDTFFCAGSNLLLESSLAGLRDYQWSDGTPGSAIVVKTAGNYQLSAIDQNECPINFTIEVDEKAIPEINLPADTFFCRNGAPLQLEFGDRFESYLWSNGATESGITLFGTQTIALTVKDSFGCAATDSLFVEAVLPPTTFVAGDRIICEGGSTELTVADSTLRYRWSTGATTQSVTIREPGVYSVQVQDSLYGCSNFYIVQIRTASPFNVDLTGDLSLCPGESTTLGTAAGYTAYQWSTGSSEPMIQANRSGLYQVTVTDEQGCTGTGETRVQTLLTPELRLPDSLLFCRDSSISLALDPVFEQYRWSDGVVGRNRSFSAPGDYLLQATHANGCVVADTVSVVRLEPPSGTIIGDSLLCLGSENTLFIAGNFTDILWSTGATDPSIGVRQAGLYSVTVTDNNNCRNTFAWEIADVNTLPPDASILSPGGICPGAGTTLRAAQVYPRYLWSTGERTPTIEIQEPGTYAITVTDEFGCTAAGQLSIDTFPLIPLALEDTIVFCTDTRVNLDASGPYTQWEWSNGHTGAFLQTDTAGNYRVAVTDNNGCIQQDSVRLIQLESVLPILDDTLSICPGDFVILDAGNGFADYQWSTGDSDRFTVADKTGIYTVDLKDTNGCDVRDSTQIVEFAVVAPVIAAASPLCIGGKTELQLQRDYLSYQWSTGDTTARIEIGNRGTYSVSVIDNNTCNLEATLAVNALAAPELFLPSGGILDCHDNSLVLQAQYPPGDLDYYWSGPGITESNQNLPMPTIFAEGQYTLHIRDLSTGCYSDTVVMQVTAAQNKPQIRLQTDGRLDCNTGEVAILANGSSRGNAFALRWYNPNRAFLETEQEYILRVDAPGTYTFEITHTEENCTVTDSIVVEADYTSPLADAGLSATLNCNTNTVQLDGSGSDQGNRYRYKWQTLEGKIISGSTTLAPLVNQPGWYYLDVVNTENGCQQRDSVWVAADFVPPVVQAGADIFLDCFDEGVRLSGSIAAAGRQTTFTWNSPEGNAISNPASLQPVVYDPGFYILRATLSENGCTDRDTVRVFPPENPPVGLELDARSPVCFGDKNGLIAVTGVQQGTEPFLFSLDGKPFVQTQRFSNLAPGNYSIAVQDAKGCSYQTQVQLGYGRDIKVDLGEDKEVQLGESVPLLAAINFSEQEIAQIVWRSSDGVPPCSDCLEAEITPLETVQIDIRITDNFGCTTLDQLLLTVQKPEALFVPNGFSPDGDGLNDRLVVYAGKDVERIGLFRILDRWGDQVFQATDFPPNDPAVSWDGTFRGQALQAGVFVYVIEVIYIDGKRKVYSGDISLIR